MSLIPKTIQLQHASFLLIVYGWLVHATMYPSFFEGSMDQYSSTKLN